MTPPILDLPASQPISTPIKKKRVLLVDSSRAEGELRAEIVRKVGIDVDWASDISEARTWWRADLYDLVLISGKNEQGRGTNFVNTFEAPHHPRNWRS